MRKNEDKLIHKIGRGVVTGVMTTALVAAPPVTMLVAQTVAVADENDAEAFDTTTHNGETADTAYEITNAKQLRYLAQQVNSGTDYSGKFFKLTADIDLSGSDFTPIGIHYFSSNYAVDNRPFKGTFDGGEHTIKGLSVSLTEDENGQTATATDTGKTTGNNYNYNESTKIGAKGLFGFVDGGTVENLKIEGAKVSGANAQGAAVGFLGDNSTVSGVTVTGSTVSGLWENAGGLVGQAGSGVTITNSKVDNCEVSLRQESENENGAGGLVGRTQGGTTTLTGNSVTGTTVTAYRKAAGLVGYILQPTSVSLSGNNLSGVTVSISPKAKNNGNSAYSGVYVAEIQGSPNTTRGYEKYDYDGNVTGLTWYQRASSGSGYEPIEAPTTIEINDIKDANTATNVARSSDISKAEVTGIPGSVTYTGQDITFDNISVKLGSTTLKKDIDYTVSYSNNRDVSANGAKVTITAKSGSNYTGTIEKTFSITKPDTPATPDQPSTPDTPSTPEKGPEAETESQELRDLRTTIENMRAIDGQIDKRRYSGDTVKAFEDAITSAQRVADKKDATADEITQAQKALTDAYKALAPAPGITMFRLYNPYSGEHLYTSSASERDSLASIGWRAEGTGWVAPASSNTPVFRLYNPYSGDHHYTESATERDSLVSIGWRYEGIGWFSDDDRGVPVYREFNPYEQVGTHNYTTSAQEDEHLGSIGWRREGIAWYGIKDSSK